MPATRSARPLPERSEPKQRYYRTARIPFPSGVREEAAGRVFRAGKPEKSADERQVKPILAGNWQTSGRESESGKVREDIIR